MRTKINAERLAIRLANKMSSGEADIRLVKKPATRKLTAWRYEDRMSSYVTVKAWLIKSRRGQFSAIIGHAITF